MRIMLAILSVLVCDHVKLKPRSHQDLPHVFLMLGFDGPNISGPNQPTRAGHPGSSQNGTSVTHSDQSATFHPTSHPSPAASGHHGPKMPISLPQPNADDVNNYRSPAHMPDRGFTRSRHSSPESFSDREFDEREGRFPTQFYIPRDWPAKIPPPALLLDFIDAFFDHIALAPRLLHRAKFTRAIEVRLTPPTSRQPPFPHHQNHHRPQAPEVSLSRTTDIPPMPGTALLHSICALAAAFVPVTTVTQTFTPASLAMTDLEDPESRAVIMAPFAFDHARWAKQIANEDAANSKRLLECVQASIILGWFSVSTPCLSDSNLHIKLIIS